MTHYKKAMMWVVDRLIVDPLSGQCQHEADDCPNEKKIIVGSFRHFQHLYLCICFGLC